MTDFTREEILVLHSGITKILNDEKDNDFKYNYGLIKNKSRLKSEAEESAEMIKMFQKKKLALMLKYCKKDDDGRPVIDDQSNYEGLQKGLNPDADAEFESLDKEQADYLKEVVSIDPYLIDADVVPKKMRGAFQEVVMRFIKE